MRRDNELIYWILAGIALGYAAYRAYELYEQSPGRRQCVEWRAQ